MKARFYYKDGSSSENYLVYKYLHREDGPAVERVDGTTLWFYNHQLLGTLPRHMLEAYMKTNIIMH